MLKLLESASDRFSVGLTTELGGLEEKCRLQVAMWGQGPAVYLLHGWGGRGANWISFIEPLAAAGFTAVVLDAPMHGDSPAPRTSILHFAAALSAVVESVGPAHMLIGHSAGGAACSLVLQNEPLSPWGTLDGVVKNRPGGLDARGVALLGAAAVPAALFGSFLRRVGVGERLHQAIRAEVEQRYGFRWESLTIRQPDRSPQIPALVIHDRDDHDVPFEDAERIAREWPDAKLFATVGLGHQRLLRDDQVVQHVVDFARTLGR